jgi:hypothetical protein
MMSTGTARPCPWTMVLDPVAIDHCVGTTSFSPSRRRRATLGFGRGSGRRRFFPQSRGPLGRFLPGFRWAPAGKQPPLVAVCTYAHTLEPGGQLLHAVVSRYSPRGPPRANHQPGEQRELVGVGPELCPAVARPTLILSCARRLLYGALLFWT